MCENANIKNSEKNITFTFEKLSNKGIFDGKPCVKTQKVPRDLAIPGFFRIFDFAVCVCFYRIGAFFVISFHFLQKYRCVPKIGFPADIFIDIFFHFHLKYRCIPKIGFQADISIDISIDVSTDKEEAEEEGRSGLLLKI